MKDATSKLHRRSEFRASEKIAAVRGWPWGGRGAYQVERESAAGGENAAAAAISVKNRHDCWKTPMDRMQFCKGICSSKRYFSKNTPWFKVSPVLRTC